MMKHTKIYDSFSIIIVPFPFTDSPKSKRRPALVLSSSDFQLKTGHITLLMITSALHLHWVGDHKIKNLHTTGLSSESIVRQKMFTIDMRLIIHEIGKLSSEDSKGVLINLKNVLQI